MIRDLLSRWGEVNLFTRPRRFGKSLNMSMLKAFFEIGGDPSLFGGLAISGEKELCEKYMGQFPVILYYPKKCRRIVLPGSVCRFETSDRNGGPPIWMPSGK